MEKLIYKSPDLNDVIPDAEISDSDIIEKVLNGNKNFYEVIMRRYNQRLFRISRSYINDEDEVQDILQESYVKAYENLDKFENRSAFSTWLVKIVINETLARKNKRKRYTSLSQNDQQNEENDNYKIYSIPSEMKNPEEEASNNELKDALEKVIDSLPEKYRTVYVMREIEGMSVADTSTGLEITESNVKVRLNRAKEMLRSSLTDIYKDTEVFNFLGSRCDKIVFNVLSRIEGK